VNIDLAATVNFKDADGIKNFMLVHRFVHEQTASALTQRFHVPASSFGLSSHLAEEAWIKLMADGKTPAKVPTPLQDWLRNHAQIHTDTYLLLGQDPTTAPDLSVVDFSASDQFYDWMFVHSQMHDFEYQQLGLT
jgi:hypothetical protein